MIATLTVDSIARGPRGVGRSVPRVGPMAFLLCLISLLVPVVGQAHSTGEHYVFLNIGESSLRGIVEFNFTDLDQKLGMPADKAEDLQQSAPAVQQYIREHFYISAGEQPFDIEFRKTGLLETEVGRFAQYFFRMDTGPLPDVLTVHDRMLLEDDPTARGVLVVRSNAKTNQKFGERRVAIVFSDGNATQPLNLLDIPRAPRPRHFITQGIWHILIGLDHILFLVALILPSVLNREGHRWVPAARPSEALWHLFKIVTLFTIAHSVTLGLAALDIITLPSRLVESVIAASILAVALNNLLHFLSERSGVLIFGFGLFHGLGFATVLGHLPFRMEDLLKVLLAFNIGVEIGQLAIVVAVWPILYMVRREPWFVPVVINGGSVVVGLMAGYWFVQRAFGL